ncbi:MULTISPECIES: extracellular solute-binding protein [Rhizobium/Agrobacterium group]|uniref:extracellular solute-binding protein n=1 Tax=Rhizobium/Agrobacterium group TaxID=227290 RepID=UPI00107F643B|nr:MULTISPECIES: extracellular solute-binding protein [Rhizobium/Agrobacterium group]MBB4404176.1 sn-glycerol 3-phosphate transport system substrate-binding protein [Agrobacterium radiobacter]MBB5590328.1 sn-glycerol 3-phosphate transport system substrate-binding protein [Agrobacterium radiobacter]TGE86735.1 glycerol 3-phosphate ABC transporter [Rhizobium sp. SEMIA 4032]
MKSSALTSFVAGVAIAAAFGATAAQAEKTKFEFWYGLSGDLGDRVQETCKKFNDSQAEFEIVCTSQNDYESTLQNTIAAYRAKKQPAITQIYDAGTLDMMLSKAFVPAKKLMADNGYKIDWNNYFPGIANYYATASGELNSFPYNSSTAMFYYNVDAFEKAGITFKPDTWEQIEEASKKLKAAGFECPLAFNFDTWMLMEQFSAIHNQPIATKANGYQGLDAELTINKTKFVDQVKFFRKMQDEKLFVVKTKQLGMDILPAFTSQTCQMFMTSIANHGTVGKSMPEGVKWDVAMLPIWKGTERHNSLVGGASLWVLAGRPEAEYKGAAAFLNFIAQPDMVEWWSTVTGYIPVTKTGFDAMKANGFYDKAPYKGREKAIESLTFTPPSEYTRGIRLGGFTQIRKEVATSLEAIFMQNADIQAELDKAVERANTGLRRFEKTYEGAKLN